MYVSYDPTLGVTYVKWMTGEVDHTVEIGDLMMVDVDDHMNPLGVEFLAPPPRVTSAMLDRLIERFPSLKAMGETENWMPSRV